MGTYTDIIIPLLILYNYFQVFIMNILSAINTTFLFKLLIWLLIMYIKQKGCFLLNTL